MSKTVILAQDLTKALKAAVRGRDSTIPILNSAKLDNGRLITTDLDRTVITNIPGDFGDPVLLPIKLTHAVLMGESGELTITKTTKGVKLAINGYRFEFDTLGLANFPQIPEIPKPMFTIEASKLLPMIARVQPAISLEESRYVLNGSLLVLKDNVLQLVATDGHRLAMTKMDDAPDGELREILHSKATAWLKRFATGSIEFAIERFEKNPENGWHSFTTGDHTLMCRILTGKYPDYKAVIPKESTTFLRFTQNPMRQVRAVSRCSDERSGAITLTVDLEKGVELAARSSERGEASTLVPCEISGQPVRIGMCERYLQDFLRFAGEEFTVGIKGGDSAMLWESETLTYVLMPMRL